MFVTDKIELDYCSSLTPSFFLSLCNCGARAQHRKFPISFGWDSFTALHIFLFTFILYIIYSTCMACEQKGNVCVLNFFRSFHSYSIQFNSLLFNQMRYAQCITLCNFHFSQHAPKTKYTPSIYFILRHSSKCLSFFSLQLLLLHMHGNDFEGNVLQKKPCIFLLFFLLLLSL